MRTRFVGSIVTGVLLVACGDGATAPATNTATSTSTTSPGAAWPGSLSPSGGAPVVPHELLDADYVLGAAGTYADGVAHVWVVVFGAASSPSLRHLASSDGSTWAATAGNVEVEDTIGLDGNGPIPSSVLRDDDGTWLMYGGGRLDGGNVPIVWRATAPSTAGPWTMHPEPVLEPSGDGWDSAVTDHPSVVHTDDGYVMAYGGASRGQRNRNRIGIARSVDGIAWTREPATLPDADDARALGPTACGMAARTMFEPELIEVDGGFRLLFGVMVDDDMFLGAASSPDGAAWRCIEDGPILEPDDFGSMAEGVHSYVLVRGDPSGGVLVEVLSDVSSDLWLVRPGDG